MQSTTKTTLKEISACATAVFYVILTLLNGFTIFFPSKWSTADFLSAYIGLPIFFAVYLGHRFICRQDPWIIPLKEVKLQANGAELNEETEDELEETTESTGLPGTWAQRLRRIARPQQHAE